MSNRTKVIIGLVILAIVAGFSIWQGSIMQGNLITINTLNEEAANLRKTQKELQDRHKDIKVDITKSRLESEQDLALIFPTDEEITSLNRIFDDFSTQNDFAENRFFISSVSYGASKNGPKDEYRIVPISMSLQASKKNLYKFIDFIDSSGALKGGVRLMSIESLNLSYPSGTGEPFGVTMTLNAYFSRSIDG